ncbi:MAG: hypothetical protein BIFFINMI_01353 [Phycisphaerae bacterium]|nr:hypothetical protein [Phycisphaerae bacterium]
MGPAKEEYALRRTPNKEAVIEKLGGSKQTEDAVKEALEWLARHQDEDGKWNVDHFNKHDVGEKTDGAGSRTGEDAGVTGLALLSFLGAGHVHNAEGPHRDVVRKALDYLITGQDAKGDLRRGGQMYAQGIACMALCEAYGLSGDPGLEAPARRAAQFILDAQTPGAGWRYQPRVQSDTSVLGWQLMALRSAEIAGLKLDTRKAHEGSSRWLDQVAKGDRGGHYQYQPGRGVTPTMTAEGLFCRMVIGEPLAQASRDESVALILANLPQRKPGDREATNLYYWYYATLVMHSIGGQEWDRWNDAMRPVLISLQRQDGNAKGSFNPVTRWGSFGGRVYSTAMAAMILEVYYRYLPFYREGAPPEATPAARP